MSNDKTELGAKATNTRMRGITIKLGHLDDPTADFSVGDLYLNGKMVGTWESVKTRGPMRSFRDRLRVDSYGAEIWLSEDDNELISVHVEDYGSPAGARAALARKIREAWVKYHTPEPVPSGLGVGDNFEELHLCVDNQIMGGPGTSCAPGASEGSCLGLYAFHKDQARRIWRGIDPDYRLHMVEGWLDPRLQALHAYYMSWHKMYSGERESPEFQELQLKGQNLVQKLKSQGHDKPWRYIINCVKNHVRRITDAEDLPGYIDLGRWGWMAYNRNGQPTQGSGCVMPGEAIELLRALKKLKQGDK